MQYSVIFAAQVALFAQSDKFFYLANFIFCNIYLVVLRKSNIFARFL